MTIICDIDGCLIEHQDIYKEVKPLEGTLQKMKEWDRKGYNIILTTGRRESSRQITEKELSKAGICYDVLVMGLGPYPRVLINDAPEGSDKVTAKAITLSRNKGIKDIIL